MKLPNSKPVLVVSHERSGTHFLMNSMAAEFGYVSKPFVNFDQPQLNINYFHPDSVLKYFVKTKSTRPDVIRKSHHQVAFFEPHIESLLEVLDIFYIYRDPRDVAHSFRHALNEWGWFEGPKVASASDFIRAAPAGQMLRFQYHQLPNMLERWRVHVEGWADKASRTPAIAAVKYSPITMVRYEDLDRRYDETMSEIASQKGWTRLAGQRPAIDQNTILKTNRNSETNVYTDSDVEFIKIQIGPTMRKLGYDNQNKSLM